MNDPALVRTRRSLHAVAEQVVAAALHHATGRIGLRAIAGGFGTPTFAGPGGVTRVRIDGIDLVVERGDRSDRAPLTTIAAAAAQIGIEPGAPADVYTPVTPLEPDLPLDLDPNAAARLASFFATVDLALRAVTGRDAPSDERAQLWPEHFDLAVTVDEVNYGGSPGDDEHPLPYLYVGPWTMPSGDDPFWNEPFGASLTVDGDMDARDAAAYFEDGRLRLSLDG